MAKGLLFASFDFSTAHADEFHDWYDLEHIPERLRVPGFINAERWISDENPNVAVATYDLDSPAVLQSAPYQAIGYENASVWTRRVTAMAKRILRFTGEQLVPGDLAAPDGAGGLLVASMNVDPAAEPEFNEVVQRRTSAAARCCARRAERPSLPFRRRRPRAQVPGAVSPDRTGRGAKRRVEQGGQHAVDRAHAAALPRPAGTSLQALRAEVARHCEERSDEAISIAHLHGHGDCFVAALLAMTRSSARRTRSRYTL